MITPVPIGEDERCDLQARLLDANDRFPGTLYAIVTGRCNKACAYCYLADQLASFPEATGNLLGGIEVYTAEARRHGLRTARLLFFGGEPGLEPTMLHRLLSKVEDLSTEEFDLRPVIFTNGLAIAEEIVDHGLACSMHWVVSLDGPASVQTRTRPDLAGFAPLDLDERLEFLSSSSADWEADVVLTPILMADITQALDYLRRFSPPLIGANTMTGFSGVYSEHKEVTIEAYTEQLIATLPVLEAEGVHVYQLEPILHAFRTKTPRMTYQCEIVADKAVIDGAGAWLPCEFFAGNQAFPSIGALREHSLGLLRSHPYFWAHCRNCLALTVCGGGCTYLSHGSLDVAACHVTKELCQWLVRRIVARGTHA